jgi:hypothetical protein
MTHVNVRPSGSEKKARPVPWSPSDLAEEHLVVEPDLLN